MRVGTATLLRLYLCWPLKASSAASNIETGRGGNGHIVTEQEVGQGRKQPGIRPEESFKNPDNTSDRRVMPQCAMIPPGRECANRICCFGSNDNDSTHRDVLRNFHEQ